MRTHVDLSRAYEYRIRTIEALLSAIEGKAQIDLLETAIRLVDSAATNLGDERSQARYANFAELLRGFLFLIRWADAIRKAESDAGRYLRAGRQAAKDLLSKQPATNETDAMIVAARKLSEITVLEQVT